VSWFLRLLIFVPVVWLIMVVYAGQREQTAAGVAKIAVRKTGKVLLFTLVLVLVMELIQLVLLP
jgi:hypothetical protein